MTAKKMAKRRWDGVPPEKRSEQTRRAALARWTAQRSVTARQARLLFKFLAAGNSLAQYQQEFPDLPVSRALEILDVAKLALLSGQNEAEYRFEKPEDAATAKFLIPDVRIDERPSV